MRDEMSDGPFETLLDRRPLLANDLGQIADGGRVEIDVERAGDDVETGELAASESRDERGFSDADLLERQWSKQRREHSQRVSSDGQRAFADAFMLREIDGTDVDALHFRVFAL